MTLSSQAGGNLWDGREGDGVAMDWRTVVYRAGGSAVAWEDIPADDWVHIVMTTAPTDQRPGTR